MDTLVRRLLPQPPRPSAHSGGDGLARRRPAYSLDFGTDFGKTSVTAATTAMSSGGDGATCSQASNCNDHHPSDDSDPGLCPGLCPCSCPCPCSCSLPPSSVSRPEPPTLLSLPPEIHLLIIENLIYPDALSLKHASRYFYHIVYTGVRLKVEWLMQRRMLHLECPNNTRCDLGSDLRFCRGSVPLLMQRRREHMECESRPNLGCLVYGTKRCTHRRGFLAQTWRFLRVGLTVELWVVLAVLPFLLLLLWRLQRGLF